MKHSSNLLITSSLWLEHFLVTFSFHILQVQASFFNSGLPLCSEGSCMIVQLSRKLMSEPVRQRWLEHLQLAVATEKKKNADLDKWDLGTNEWQIWEQTRFVNMTLLVWLLLFCFPPCGLGVRWFRKASLMRYFVQTAYSSHFFFLPCRCLLPCVTTRSQCCVKHGSLR